MPCVKGLTQCCECKWATEPASWICRQLLAPSDDETTGLSTSQSRAALCQQGLCLAGLRGQSSQCLAQIGRGILNRHRAA